MRAGLLGAERVSTLIDPVVLLALPLRFLTLWAVWLGRVSVGIFIALALRLALTERAA